MNSTSLQARLMGVLLVLLGIFLAAALLLANARADRAARRDVDSRLQVTAALIVRYHEISGQEVLPAGPPLLDPEDDRSGDAVFPAFEIRMASGEILTRSDDFPTSINVSGPGYSDGIDDDLGWRLLTVADAGRGRTYRAGINSLDETRLARIVRGDILVPLMTMLSILAIAVLSTVWLGLRPLRRVERAIESVEPDQLQTLELDPARMPRELSSFTAVLNSLLDRLRLLVRHQRAFVMAAGHELRTPLAGCMAQLEVIQQTSDLERRSRSLENLGTSLHRMELLVGKLLVLARSERSSLRPDDERFSVDALVDTIVLEYQAEGHDVVLHSNPEPFWMQGDAAIIESMIRNLVSNAVRFSPPGCRVDISLRAEQENLLIEVSDLGPGIPTEDKVRVFETFYRGVSPAKEGTGLGLAIVKAAAVAHHGRVEIVDHQPRGTCVRVVMPFLFSSGPT